MSFDNPSALTEPPLTIGLELEELKAIVEDPLSYKLRYARAHNTTAERYVALSSEVNKSFPVGAPGRRGLRFEQEMSSKLYAILVSDGTFRSRQDYKLHFPGAFQQT